MDFKTANRLRELNNGFYRDYHESFSESRQAPWPGWSRVARHFDLGPERYKLLDVACGNMRFERFLSESFPHAEFEFECIDYCTDLACPMPEVTYRECDVVKVLLASGPSTGLRMAQSCDAAVSFGFMHHIPGSDARALLLEALLNAVKPLGLVAVSFWCFTRDDRMAGKAQRNTDEALKHCDVALDDGDFLLGWNKEPHAVRYCHSFTDDEIDDLLAQLPATCSVADRFDADGRTGNLNTYAVLHKGA